MADFTDSRSAKGSAWPENAVESSWDRYEPLVTPAQVISRHLFGIPLQGRIRDPLTGLYPTLTEDHLKDFIIQAVGLAEAETGLEIMPTQHVERHPFDRALFDSFGYFLLRHRPVSSIEELAVKSANETEIFVVPQAWIETGYLHRGQVNILPFGIGQIGGAPVPAPGGTLFLSFWGNRHWIPAVWSVKYTTGFKDGRIPNPVNQLIGVIAAMEVLSTLATTWVATASQSLGIDGLSQSTSQNPQIFDIRLQALADKRKWLIGKLRSLFGVKFALTNV